MTTITRYLGALLFVTLLLLPLSPGAPRAVQANASPLTAEPAAFDESLALGARRELSLLLRNSGTEPITPRLFVAAAAAAAAPAVAAAPALAGAREDGPQVDPQIAEEQAADPAGMSEFLVVLADQADLAAAYAIDDWAARGEYVYRTLSEHAANSQASLRAELRARGLAYTPFWIVNALAVRGDAAVLASLAADTRVAELRATRVAELVEPPAAAPAQTSSFCSADAANVCWHLRQLGASRVWDDFGVRGEGITVANVDSGVRFDHPALRGQYRGIGPDGIDHRYNWFDPYGAAVAPTDSGNHGTHVMGIMVGAGRSASEPSVGVAPAARWIAARACSARECSEVNLILAAQWLLAPTDQAGQNPRPDLRPHVINNSWTSGQDSPWFLSYVNAWRAAGIYPVFAAGNSGNSTCGTIQSPGDYAMVTAVGATDSSDRLASFSSIGPTQDGRFKPDLIAPGSGVVSTVADTRLYASNSGTSMAAPQLAGAVAVLWSAQPSLIGDYAATYAALTASAFPITLDARFLGDDFAACRPDQLPNNLSGYGRLDLYAALARVRVELPWLRLSAANLPALAPGTSTSVALTLDARFVPEPGVYEARVLVHGADLSQTPLVVPVTLRVFADASTAVVSGQVTRVRDGAPLAASVTVAGGATAHTDAQGRYSLSLPPSVQPYQFTAAALGHNNRTASLSLSAGQMGRLDFALEENQPRLGFDSTQRRLELALGDQRSVPFTLSNAGTLLLSYSARLLDEHYGVWRSDEPESPQATWRDPPPGAVTLALAADGVSAPLTIGFSFPFFNTLYDELSVTANGLIVFGSLSANTLAFSPSCTPLGEGVSSRSAIAVLSADLDPSGAGARVSYARLAEGLLVSWEQTPLAVDSSLRLSFQALLRPDGRISLHYRDVAGLTPAAWASVGLRSPGVAPQIVSCRDDRPLHDGLSIELRPQPATSFWASLSEEIGSIAPGEQAELAPQVRWFSPHAHPWPLSAVIELRSNDPGHPLTRLTVRASSLEAPYRVLLMLFFP
jgi:subtilisin family serine protease